MSLILFFTNVGPNLANDITEPDENISIYDYLGESIEQSLFMRPVDEEEVITTVTGCTEKRSSDFEDISMDTVAKVVSVICKPLAHICNISFRTGVFPSRMKIAKVIPMFKSGTKTDVTNYSLQAYVKKAKFWVDSWQPCLKTPKKSLIKKKNGCQVYN